jgi:predicted outer membrane repeat protein
MEATMRFLKVLTAHWLLTFSFAAASSSAEDYPQKPIKIIVGTGAGGITDVATRIYAQAVAEKIGQNIVIENRAGGGGAIAATAVTSAPPDGYTLLSFYGSQMAAVTAMQNVGFDPVSGFQPITLLCENIMFLVVPADGPVNSISDLLDPNRKRPEELVFGTPGVGTPSHLLGERLARAQKTPIRVAHYRGGPAMMTDLIAGRIDFTLPSYTLALPFITSKKVKVLAVDTRSRLPEFPEIPTLDEVGLGSQRVASWIGLAAPAGTNLAIINKLSEEFGKAAKDPELRKRLAQIGTPIRTSTPDEMRSLLKAEMENTDKLIQDLGMHK